MMRKSLSIRFVLLALTLAVFATNLFGDDDESAGSGEDGDKTTTTEDTCGKLAGNLVVFTTSVKYGGVFAKGYERWDNEYSLAMRTLTKGANGLDTFWLPLLSWTDFTHGWMVENQPMAPACRTDKNGLTLKFDKNPLAEFTYKQEHLALSPAFRRRIIAGVEKGDSTVSNYDLQTLLSGTGVEDTQIVEALRVYALKDSIGKNFIDYSIEALRDFIGYATDKPMQRYAKHLSDSLIAWKKSEQPVTLEGAKKVGRILSPPIYPPLDSPSVFWKDSLLCVVQEEKAKPILMRTFDPRSGKWGAKTQVKYPESGMYQMYEKNTGTYSMACPYETLCWSKKLGAFSSDPCDGIECGPLLILDDTAVGAVENLADRLRAGGSCAAGDGTLEFVDGGYVKNRSDSTMAWPMFDRPLTYASRSYNFALKRAYPVVVSPDQNWIAYAYDAKDGKAVELWVARLRYKR